MDTIALAHEWLAERAGSEKVFERIARCFPDADLFALTRTTGVDFDLGGRSLRTSFLDRSMLRDRRALSLPIMPIAWRTISTRRYSLVVTSTHAFGRYFRPARHAMHLNYCHAPMRYVWTPWLDPRSRSVLAPLVRPALRWADQRSVEWTDHIAVNSTVVAERVARFYGRAATVIPPPVDVDFYTRAPREPRSDYFLTVSRFIPYKRLDLAIRASALAGVRLVVAGSGPGERMLRRLAAEVHPTGVTFVIAPSDDALRSLYARAVALVFPGIEDFGLVPVEAQAAGTPVVAPRAGGTIDTVVDQQTGVLLDELSPTEVAHAMETVVSMGEVSHTCRQNAETFSAAAFDRRFSDWVYSSARGSAAMEVPRLAPAASAS